VSSVGVVGRSIGRSIDGVERTVARTVVVVVARALDRPT
tara:strand:- start:18231 stop:18347 length:117 start_codon:yes stop_codon:yes gene_type:complete